MSAEKSVTEKILHVLRPYASNWNGTLGRGDLVIPQREISRVVHEILDAMHELTDIKREAPEGDRRVVMIDVTPIGRAALERVSKAAEAHLADVLAPLDLAARRRLVGGLGVLRKVFAGAPASMSRNSHRTPAKR